MERKFLEDLGLEKETVDKILDQNSADIGKHIKTIGALELERDGLKTQLSDANRQLEGFDPEWKKKAEAAAAKDTSPWDNSTGGSSLGEGIDEVGKVGEVGKVKDDINIAEEDLKFLRDIAEMRYVQNFVTLTPTIAMDAQISEMVDVDEVVSRMEKKLEDEFVSAAEGVYA